MHMARALKVGVAWTSIVWVVCYLILGLTPGIGPKLWSYLFHMNMTVENIFTIGNFVVGLILWNIIVASGIALGCALSNYIK